MLTCPLESAAIAGFHSLADEFDTCCGAENWFSFCVAEKIAALPSRHPCHATHTRPCASEAATGNTSDPEAFEIATVCPGFPFSRTRAESSYTPFLLLLSDQKTHGLPLPSTAMAGRYRSPPGALTAIGSLHLLSENSLTKTWSPLGGSDNFEKSFGAVVYGARIWLCSGWCCISK